MKSERNSGLIKKTFALHEDESDRFGGQTNSLPFPSSLCRAPCVFGGTSSEDRAFYFLCQPAAGIHLPAPRGSDKDQHRAHFGGHAAAPPVQDLCHSTLAWTRAVRHRPSTKQSYLLLWMYVLRPYNIILSRIWISAPKATFCLQ